jgi:hypothetical protein
MFITEDLSGFEAVDKERLTARFRLFETVLGLVWVWVLQRVVSQRFGNSMWYRYGRGGRAGYMRYLNVEDHS